MAETDAPDPKRSESDRPKSWDDEGHDAPSSSERAPPNGGKRAKSANGAKDADAKASDKDEEPKIPSPFAFLRGGNPLRLKRGGLFFAIGGIGAFLLMARDGQWRWGVPVGFFCILVAVFGALDLIGSFDDLRAWATGDPRSDKSLPKSATTLPPSRTDDKVHPLGAAAIPFAGFLVALLTTMTLMAHGRGILWGLAVTVGWIATVVFGYKSLAAVGIVDDVARPLLHRHGFWLIVFCCVLYLPALGAHGLVDPWETHYGEVSRDILARDDWITIWWAEEGYFVSKPILDFWMQALAMATFGVRYLPDGMIAPTTPGGDPTRPEWIVRLPSLALAVIALYLAYRAVAQVRGRRAGLISALVMATMGDYFMLAHQSITDMPFVASITAAMSLLIIGLTTDDDRTVKATKIQVFGTTLTVSAFHLAMTAVLVCALPQVIYLISRNATLITHGDFGFSIHPDEYRPGNGRLCWMPPSTGDTFERLMRIGKWPCDLDKVAHKEMQPALQGTIWLGLLALLLALNRNERRISRLCFTVAWVFAGISTMGKGVAGILLPMGVAGTYVLCARKWRDVLRLELLGGFIVLATVAAPWFVAMYGRMGDNFIQQLFVHHMWKRALDHVHDTNTGDDVSIRYYVWQLGYAFFPWTGLVPAGLIWWARDRWGQAKKLFTVAEQRQRDVTIFLVMWFVFAFGLFTYMKTKFHHYVFPAVPAAAMLTGIFLDDAMGKAQLPKRGLAAWLGATTVGTALMVYGFSRLVPGRLSGHLPLPDFEKMSTTDIAKWLPGAYPASPAVGVLIGVVGLVIAILAARLLETPPDGAKAASAREKQRETTRGVMFGGLALAGAIGSALILRDLSSRPETDIKGQERLIQLYTYRYDRVWPKELNFQPALVGFGVAVTVLMLVMAARAYRRQAIVALTAVSTLYAAWTLDDYMMYIAPHWGQRPIFEAYYRDRQSAKEPLVAFEMNWKGENFYSGGRLVEFGNGMGQGATAGERGSDRLRTWLADMRNKTKAVYFVTEANRVPKIDEMLRGILGAPPNGGTRWTVPITSDKDDNKFMVVRVRFPG